MRTHRQFLKSITLTALLFTGFAAGIIAQDTTTIANPETETPVVLSTSPTNGEMNVELDSAIEITFSSVMDETTINESTFLLHANSAESMHKMHGDVMMDDQMKDRSARKDSEKSRHSATDAVNGTISYSNNVAVFTPDNDLKKGTRYTFTVTNGVKSSANLALENEHAWSFTTTGTSDSTYSDGSTYYDDMTHAVDSTYSDGSTYTDESLYAVDSSYTVRPTFAADSMFTHGSNYSVDTTYTDKKNDSYRMGRYEYRKNTSDTTLSGKSTMIHLGKAGQFVMLAKTTINNESDSRITGHTGEGSVADKIKKEKVFTDSVRQRTPGQVLVLQSNKSDTTNADVSEAIEDMMSAYSDASLQNGNDSTSNRNEHFQDSVMTGGVYEWSDSLHIMTDVTLSGSENDVWLFKVGDDLTVAENTVFTLTNGARAENVFWYVEGEVTIGKNAHFEGIILSMNEITLEKGAQLNGRMFSQASITLDDNTINEPEAFMTGQTSSTNVRQ
jgi:hypothetical protein